MNKTEQQNITDSELSQQNIQDAHGTHRKFLEFYILKSTGNILEFGCGNSSTGLIKSLIKGTSRKLISYENNQEWYNKMTKELPEDENHQYIFVNDNDWETCINSIPKINWGLVFIDQSPWEARTMTMKYFKDIADYIMIHDVDYFSNNNFFGTFKKIPGAPENALPEYNYSDISDNWKLYYPERPWPSFTGPPTLVFSNTGKEIFTFKEKERCGMVGCGFLQCLCPKL